jgi:hypothetical protein
MGACSPRAAGQGYPPRVQAVAGRIRGHFEPDATACAYLHVIASEPEMVRKALAPRKIA